MMYEEYLYIFGNEKQTNKQINRQTFIPEDKGSGKYTVSLKPKMAESMKVFNVDSMLPIQKIPFPPLKSFDKLSD